MKHLPLETTEFLKKICVEDPDETTPDDYLHLFVRNNEGLLDFLEHMIEERPDCSEVIYNNLLEHYLHHYKTQSQVEGKELEHKILDILSSPKLSYDNDQALVLCQLHNFLRGTLYLYEKKGLHEQILKLHLEMNNLQAGLETCRQFGEQHPNLWVEALTLLGDCSNTVPNEVIEEILNTIEEKALMSPLLVVRTLAGSPIANLGIVRRYLLNVYQNEEKQIDEHAKIIAHYQADTEKVRGRIHELRSNAVTLQQSKCSACHQGLELPTLHFLCGHSYHKHCFQSYADNDNECPACLVENKKILDIVKSQQQSREQHDAFHSQLEKAEDGFAVVADYFGRGMFRQDIDFESLEPIPESTKTTTHGSSRVKERSVSPPRRPQLTPVTTSTPTTSVPAKAQNESLNPFGTPEESPVKEMLSSNPFGEPEDDYDEGMNPFSE